MKPAFFVVLQIDTLGSCYLEQLLADGPGPCFRTLQRLSCDLGPQALPPVKAGCSNGLAQK